MYGYNDFKSLTPRFRWYTMRRKLEYAKNPVRNRIAKYSYRKRVVPHLQASFKSINKAYGKKQYSIKPSFMKGRKPKYVKPRYVRKVQYKKKK